MNTQPDGVQKLVIEPEELAFLVQEMTRQEEEGRTGLHTVMCILAQRYSGDHERAFCVHVRVRCLISLLDDPRMRGWSPQTAESGCRMTQAAFHAAAICPLRLANERYYFNADEFFRIAFQGLKPEASA